MSLLRAWLLAGCMGLALPVAAASAEAQLASLLQQTLRVHPQLQAKRALTKAAHDGVDAVAAQRYPTLSANLAQTGEAATTNRTLQLTQPLWTFGHIDAQLAVAKGNEELAGLDEWRTARQLLEKVAVAYANVLGLQAQRAVTAQNLQVLQGLQQKIQRRHQGQLSSLSDVRLMQTRLAQAQVQDDRLQVDLATALEDLHTLTRQRLQAVAPLPHGLLQAAEADPALAQAELSNPELRYLQQQAEVSSAEVQQVLTSAMPTVFAQVLKPVSGGGTTTTGVFLQASLEGGGGVLKGRLAAAAARAESAQAEVAALREQLQGSLSLLQLQQAALARTALQLKGSLESARLTYESYMRQYEAGFKSWLDVLNMQREVNEQGLAIAQNQVQWNTAGLRLASLAGRLDALAGWAPTSQESR